jgi:DNA-binding transcriptional LysR family regulator
MDRFLSIEAFARVAQTRNFAEAARQMNVSKSVMSKRVQQLEDFVGSPLFHRTTRSVRLTDIGLVVYRDCAALVCCADELIDRMQQMGGAPSGLLRVHALPGFVIGHFAQTIREFQDRYPKIKLDLVVDDAIVDPVKAGFECTLQIFDPSSEDLVAKRLFPVRRLFCASPDYLHAHGEPAHPTDLHRHRLGLYSRYPTRDRWVFRSGSDEISVELQPALRSNSVHLLADFALEHAGIVCLPTTVASAPIMQGALRPVLTAYRLSSFWLSAVFSTAQRSTVRLRLFLDALAQGFPGEPPWDERLIRRGYISVLPDD